MRVKIHPDQESASKTAAAIIAGLVRRKPKCVLGLATGSSPLGSRTRLKTLAAETVRDSARFFGDEARVPRLAITMGVGTILASRPCQLLAFGETKAEAIRDAIEGPITAQVTASALQLHRDVIVVLDPQSASLLQRKEYYRDVERSEEMLAAGRLGELGIGNK